MKGRFMLATILVVLGIAPLTVAQGLDVELQVVEQVGLARQDEPVSGGVPLPIGLVKDPATLRLLDAHGSELPAQFSAINRWGHDQTVMWLLVQSVATLPANGTLKYRLKADGPSKARVPVPLTVKDEAEAVVVDTGAIRFTVHKKRFNLITQAWITSGGKQELVISSGANDGSVMTLINGEAYASSAEPPSEVMIEESGPLRATVVVRGLHKPVGGTGSKLPYLYGYLARIRAYAGQPFVRISYALTSGHEPAIGSPLCKTATVGVGLARKMDVVAQYDGGITVADDKAQVDLCVRYLKENNPALVRQDGLSLQLLPWGEKEEFLDICSYKTYEMQLTFQPRENAVAGEVLLGTFTGYLRFWCDPAWVSSTCAWGDFGYVAVPDAKVADLIKRRFRPYALTGWRDHGSTPEFESGSSRAPGGGYEPLLKTAPFYLGYLQTNDRRQFDQLERTSWHWRDRRYIYLDGDWSEKSWTGRGGVYYAYYAKGGKDYPDVQPPTYSRYSGSWNYGGRYGPMDTQHFSVDEVVGYYYLTGDRQCLEALRAYGKQAASFCGAFARAEKAKIGREHGWVTRALISIYEATGDKKLFELVRGAVRAIIANQDKTAGCISDVNEKVKDPQTGALVPVRHTPFMNAAVAMALGRYYRHHPEEEVRDAILGIADWLCYDVAEPAGGFSYVWTTENPGSRSGSGHRCMSTMSWAYLATGQKRYLEAADKHAGRLDEWYQNGFGQEYVYIKTTPRPDAVAPDAVRDLRAEPMGEGKVKLFWTAPGDDGTMGRAVEYQVKYATKEIKERADWRTKADVEISFWAATNCKGEPPPSEAGTKESFVLEGLEPGTYWFALKTYDEQPNQSDLSNVVRVEVR